MYNKSSTGEEEPTVGIDFHSKNIVVDGTTIRLQVWDTAGQEQYHSLVPSYLRNSTIAIVVYDITSRDTFDHLDSWIKLIHDHANPHIIIVGNKSDLDSNREIPTEEGERYAKANTADFIETTCREDPPTSIEQLFKIVSEVPSVDNASSASKVDVAAANDQAGSGCGC